ncbi:hypothetical protein ACE6ED_10835 [Paenibacillus sp. CN-4]|uniref:hypothetical protein n=1 Tax=Paenibacillus nanchangensis TaxID=3348343 RepID=UPI00397CAC4D
MMKDPYTAETQPLDVEQEEISETRIMIANYMKYGAYIILFFGLLYFLVQFVLPHY